MGRVSAQSGWQDGASLKAGPGGITLRIGLDEESFAAALRSLGESSPAGTVERPAVAAVKVDKDAISLISAEFGVSLQDAERALQASGGGLSAAIARLTLVSVVLVLN